MLDAAVFPRVKICAGWVTPEALVDLEVDPDKYPLTIQPFDQCVLEFAGARHETGWRRPTSYGIIRREFDHYLLERAAAAGADVRWGVRVTDVVEQADRVRVETERGAFEAPVVIGAGGHRCPVARVLGQVSGREEVVVAQESETRLPPEWVARLEPFLHAPELYVEPDLRGYGWYFPKRRLHQHRRGVHPGRATAACPAGATRCWPPCARRAGCPTGCRSSRSRGTRTSCGGRRPAACPAPASASIGDAAGLARDLSGEGIGPAIRSGRLAAEAVTALIRQGTPLDGYARQIVARYGPGELGWLRRKLSNLPDALARLGVRVVLGSEAARRRIVFDSIFGMREVAP